MENNRRAEVFDLNREIIIEEMADQDVQQLQQALQQLQEQHEREMAALRQQLAQPERVFQLTADQVLNKFHQIRTFYGKDDYSLQEFISAVENVGVLCGNNAALLRHGFQMVFKEKIQGDAKRCIQRLGDNLTWEAVKAELKIQFRPRKSYKRLMDESRNIKVNNLRELFNIMRSINFQLNELYEYDDNRPTNYSPDNNDKNLVDIVKDMLTGSYRVNIRNNMTLNDVFNLFDDLNLLDESDVIHYNYRRNNRDSRHNNAPRRDFKREDNGRQGFNFRSDNFYGNRDRNIRPQQNNFGYNSGNFRRNDNFRQDRNFVNNNRSEQYRQNFDQRRQFENRNNFNNRSGQFRQGQNNNFNNEVPMEIDNIQRREVNFSNPPREEDSP